jgi:hypothetical protein
MTNSPPDIAAILDRLEYALAGQGEIELSIAIEAQAALANDHRLAALRQLGQTHHHRWLQALQQPPGSPAWQQLVSELDQAFPITAEMSLGNSPDTAE